MRREDGRGATETGDDWEEKNEEGGPPRPSTPGRRQRCVDGGEHLGHRWASHRGPEQVEAEGLGTRTETYRGRRGLQETETEVQP